MTIVDKRAYTEVCEILKHVSKEEINKIPKEIIKFFENNKDEKYNFTYDVSQSLEEQKVLRKTNSIIIYLFKEYFATNVQKDKINNILRQNELIYQKDLMEKYKTDNLFKKHNLEKIGENEVAIVEYKGSLFKRIINKIKKLFGIN